MPLRQIEWVSRMINSSHMSSLEPPCPGATRRGVAPTPIRGWGSSQCRSWGAAAPIRLYDGNQIYPLKTAKSQKYHINNLWKFNLNDKWRLTYSVTSDENVLVIIIIEWFDHKAYNKLFGYG